MKLKTLLVATSLLAAGAANAANTAFSGDINFTGAILENTCTIIVGDKTVVVGSNSTSAGSVSADPVQIDLGQYLPTEITETGTAIFTATNTAGGGSLDITLADCPTADEFGITWTLTGNASPASANLLATEGLNTKQLGVLITLQQDGEIGSLTDSVLNKKGEAPLKTTTTNTYSVPLIASYYATATNDASAFVQSEEDATATFTVSYVAPEQSEEE